MKRSIFILILLAVSSAVAQERATFTGTTLIYGSGLNTRTTVRQFRLTVNGVTSANDAQTFLSTLQDRGQDSLLSEIRNRDLGRFSIAGSVGRPLNAVVVSDQGGKRLIRAVFERWIGFGELRGGYRSTDYPFSYVELVLDPRTGQGEGTFIPAARIRWTKKGEVEIEDFGTFPGRLMGVKLERGRVPS